MRKVPFLLSLTAAAAITAAPGVAGDFSLFGAYWDTDVAGDTAGGGIKFGIPLGERFTLDIRGTYFEEIEDDPFSAIFDSDDPVFQEAGIQAIPVDLGVSYTFVDSSAAFRPYITGGISYILLDSDFGEIDDETGWFAGVGAEFGDDIGPRFFVEGIYRKAEAEVNLDPDDLDDLDDIDIDDNATFDIDGASVNAGIRWSF
jgi:hypothetical protein